MSLPPGWIYEAVTAVILAAVPLYIVWLWLRRRAQPAGPVHGLAALAGVALWGVVFWGSFVTPNTLQVQAYPVRLGAGNQTLRLVVVSDTHLGVYKHRDWLIRVVKQVNALAPDAVILAGDFVTVPAGLAALDPFSNLRAPLGVWAVLGNYDYRVGAVTVRQKIESYGVEVLTNEAVELVGTESADLPSVWLVGLDDYQYGQPDWEAALAEVPAEALKIVVSHNPSAAPQAEVEEAALLIAGHTHGGQIRWPGFGPVARLPIDIDQSFDQGLFDYGQLQLLISPGVGESGPRARLFSRPEITVAEIVY